MNPDFELDLILPSSGNKFVMYLNLMKKLENIHGDIIPLGECFGASGGALALKIMECPGTKYADIMPYVTFSSMALFNPIPPSYSITPKSMAKALVVVELFKVRSIEFTFSTYNQTKRRAHIWTDVTPVGLLATCSIPYFISPVLIDGDLHMDGVAVGSSPIAHVVPTRQAPCTIYMVCNSGQSIPYPETRALEIRMLIAKYNLVNVLRHDGVDARFIYESMKINKSLIVIREHSYRSVSMIATTTTLISEIDRDMYYDIEIWT